MLISVDVSNNQGGYVSLPMQDTSSGIVVDNIDGLDPVKATLVSSSFANMDGGQFHSARREARNIVLTLGLDPQYEGRTVQERRRLLYNVCMPKSFVRLVFTTTDLPPVMIEGYVESAEAPLFAQDPQFTISIVCYKPDFVDPISTVVNGVTSDVDGVETLIDYPGTVETGVEVVFSPASPDYDFNNGIIRNRTPGYELQTFSFDVPLGVVSQYLIGTIPGQKYVRSHGEDGTERSVLQNVDPFSAWITLYPGLNYVQFYMSLLSVPCPWSLRYMTRYGGL